MSQVTVRHATPEDAAVLTRIYSQPETQAGTLHLPYQSPSLWQERLANPRPHVTIWWPVLKGRLSVS